MKLQNKVCVALSGVLLSAIGHAATIDLELEAGVGHSDNIGQVPDGGVTEAADEIVYNAGIALTYEEDTARAEVDIRGSLDYIGYDTNSFGSETLPALDASAIFNIIDRNLTWQFQGNIGQQSIDPFAPVTPGNRQDVTFLTTGPAVLLPLSSRFAALASASYSDVNYEEQPFDNGRLGARIGVLRQISSNRSLSLNVSGERTKFDDDQLNSPIERYDAFLRFATQGARNDLSVDVGWSSVERSGVDTDEPLAVVEWRRRITEVSNFSLEAGTRVSDAAQSFRGNQVRSVDIGQVQNQTDLTAPFREDFAVLTIAYDRPRTDIYASVNVSDESYEDVGQLDRQTSGLSLDVTRQLGTNWEGTLFASVARRDYGNLGRDDEDRWYGASLGWRQLETIHIDLRIERNERDSSDALNNLTENRVQLLFRYRPRLGR